MEYAAARTGLAELALSGCSTVFDHHYVFPRGVSGLVEAEVAGGARARRPHRRLARLDGPRRVATAACRPTSSSRTSTRSSPTPSGSPRSPTATWSQIAVAPCSPFSVTTRLMEESAALARRLGLAAPHAPRRDGRGGGVLPRALRLHARSSTSSASAGSTTTCGARTASTSRTREVDAFGDAGVGVAHCPTSNLRLGAGIAPVRELLDAGVRVGLGVDGSASNERGDLFLEVKQALLVARGRGGAGGDDRARRASPRRRAAARPCSAATTSARSSRASAPTSRSGAPTGSSSAAPTTRSRGLVLSGPHRVDRLLVGGEDVVRDGRLVNADEAGDRPRAPRSRRRGSPAMITSRPTSSTPSAARPPPACASSSGAATSSSARRDRRRRPRSASSPTAEPGDVPARLPPAVAVLPPRRARGRARRRPPPRSAARLVVRVRELPRQLSVDQLAELFEGRTRFVERLAELDDPLGRAREVAATLTDDEKKEVLDAHPAIGESRSPRARRRAGRRPEVLAELAELNRAYEERFGFRFVVFVNRRPKRELVPILRERLGAHARARSSRPALDELVSIASDRWQRGAHRARRLLVGWGDLLFRWLHVIAAIAWIGAVVLLHRARQPPAPARRRARRASAASAARRGRSTAAASTGSRSSASRPTSCPSRSLVQVGGVHDVALGLRAARRRLLRPRLDVPRRPERRRPRDVARRSRSRSAGSRSAWLVYDGLCRLLGGASWALARRRVRASRARRRGRQASCSRRGRRTSRSAR